MCIFTRKSWGRGLILQPPMASAPAQAPMPIGLVRLLYYFSSIKEYVFEMNKFIMVSSNELDLQKVHLSNIYPIK